MTVEQFDAAVRKVPYQPKGIFFSEMYAFVETCLRASVTEIVETGVRWGASTRVLSAVKCWRRVTSFDFTFIIPPPPGVTFVSGDARKTLPPFLDRYRGGHLGVLIDGPKGLEAHALREMCLTYPFVRVVALHGPRRGHGETTHTHNAEWASARVLDGYVPDEFRAIYPDGPGLAIWVAS